MDTLLALISPAIVGPLLALPLVPLVWWYRRERRLRPNPREAEAAKWWPYTFERRPPR